MLEASTTATTFKMRVKLYFWINLVQTGGFCMKFENLKASWHFEAIAWWHYTHILNYSISIWCKTIQSFIWKKEILKERSAKKNLSDYIYWSKHICGLTPSASLGYLFCEKWQTNVYLNGLYNKHWSIWTNTTVIKKIWFIFGLINVITAHTLWYHF